MFLVNCPSVAAFLLVCVQLCLVLYTGMWCQVMLMGS